MLGVVLVVVEGELDGVVDVERLVVVDGAELETDSGGNGAMTVDSLDDPVTITNAMTNPATRTTAVMAAIHSHLGDLGPPGGGVGGSPGP